MGAGARVTAEERKDAQQWRLFNADKRYDLAGSVWRGLVTAWGVYWTFRIFRVLSGRTINAHFAVSFLAWIEHGSVAPWSLTGGFGILAVVERSLRHRITKRLSARNLVLERKIDPNRTSSDLAPDDEQHPILFDDLTRASALTHGAIHRRFLSGSWRLHEERAQDSIS